MYHFSSVAATGLVAHFPCPDCGTSLTSDEISVPRPNYQAERASDSYNWEDDLVHCEECGKDTTVTIWCGYHDAYVDIDGLSPDSAVELDLEYDEAEYADYFDSLVGGTEYWDVFEAEIENIRTLLTIPNADSALRTIVRKQVYVGAITCLETYLMDAFVSTVLSNSVYLKAFVKSLPTFRQQKFQLSEVFETADQIEAIARTAMLEVLYHNIPHVSGMYRDTLSIQFPDYGDIMRAVIVRHDLVHRNGKTKDGQKHELTDEEVAQVLDSVKQFISEIDTHLRNAQPRGN